MQRISTACPAKQKGPRSRGPSARWLPTYRLAVPVVAVPVVMPAGAEAKRYRGAVVVIVVTTLTRIVVAATVVRARRAYTDAYSARAGVKADLCHCGRGSENGRCGNKAKRDLFHDGSPLGTWLGKRLRRNRVPPPTTFLVVGSAQKYRTNFAELWNRLRFDRYAGCSAHSAATRKSCGASSCSGFLPLSQDWKRSR